MEISGEYTFDAPRELVWQALNNPEVLSSIVPGSEGLEESGENEYIGNLNIKVGPVQGKFKGQINMTNLVEPESYHLDVDGKGAPGFVKANGDVKLADQEDKTLMTYEGTARVGGRIASVGQRLLDSSAKSIIRQSLEGLNEYLKTQVAAQEAAVALGATEEEAAEAAEQVEMPIYEPPSQTAVAMNVARDVADDLLPAQYRPIALIGIAAIIIVILLVMRRILK